jgi:hypothetical protein
MVDDISLGLFYPKPQLSPSVGVLANLTLGKILIDRLLVANRFRLLHHLCFPGNSKVRKDSGDVLYSPW